MVETLQVAALAGYEPEIGRWLWAMQAVRRRTLKAAMGLDQRALDWEGPDQQENAIGSLLYHIAMVEMGWLYFDILGRELPSQLKADFPHAISSEGRITRVPSVPLERHLERLARSRVALLEEFRGMSLDDWERLRSPKGEDYQVTPAWAVFHLVEHESAHAAQIIALKKRAARVFAGATPQ